MRSKTGRHCAEWNASQIRTAPNGRFPKKDMRAIDFAYLVFVFGNRWMGGWVGRKHRNPRLQEEEEKIHIPQRS